LPTNLGEFVWWGFLLALSVCGFFSINVLTKIDRNQSELFERINNHETRLSKLEGAHEVNHGGGKG
jgi:hypothetical protein